MATDIPVLVLAFRRVDVLSKVLAATRLASPSTIYVNVDGPREASTRDREQVELVYQYLANFAADCPVVVRRCDANLGLGEGVCSALDWFFQHEQRGVILEDDVYIQPNSLKLAAELLEKYQNDRRVGSVSLFNPVPRKVLHDPESTYRFSRIPSSQYWGTWQDRWKLCSKLNRAEDVSVPDDLLLEIGGSAFMHQFRTEWHPSTVVNTVPWEGRWLATHLHQRWMVATTNANFSLHLGFNAEATNSHEQPSWYPTRLDSWDGRLIMPRNEAIDTKADRWYLDHRYGSSPALRLRRAVRKAFPWLARAWRSKTVKTIVAPHGPGG